MERKLLALLLLLWPLPAYALELPQYTGFVNDFANIIDDATEAKLENDLQAFEQETNHEIAVATVPNLQEVPIEEFSLSLAEQWGIGKAGNDNGALLLVAPNEREVRIEVGYGLEPVLTDAFSKMLIENVIIPQFRNGDYAGGIEQGLTYMMQAAKGEEVIIDQSSKGLDGFAWILPVLMFAYFFIWILGSGMRTIHSLKTKGFIRILVGAFSIVMTLGISLIVSILAFALVGGCGFLFDLLAHKYRDTKKEALPWWLKIGQNGGRHRSRGMWFGGGGGSSGGFSGFGGGGFGGGGSSGSW